MGGHDPVRVAGREQAAVGLQFHGLPTLSHIDKAQVGVAAGAAVAGKMLEAATHAQAVVGLDKGAGTGDHGCRVSAEAALVAADDGVGRVQFQVHHGCEVEVHAAVGQHGGQGFGVLGDHGRGLAAQARGADTGGKAVALLEPADPAALLVDADQQRQGRELLQVIDQPAQLIRRHHVLHRAVHVAVEENHPAQPLVAYRPDQPMIRAQRCAAEAEHKQLAESGRILPHTPVPTKKITGRPTLSASRHLASPTPPAPARITQTCFQSFGISTKKEKRATGTFFASSE